MRLKPINSAPNLEAYDTGNCIKILKQMHIQKNKVKSKFNLYLFVKQEEHQRKPN